MVILVVLLIVGLIFFVVFELINISVCGFPPKDEDVLKFVEKVREGKPYLLSGAKPDSMISSSGNPYISNSLKTVLMGCYINDVGAIPRWYKSYDEIQKLYVELGANSGKTKKEKLGL
tara:strand:+ start:115 stop:468 length:354 start_codon:yes stop_codon:yes gene_type:complete